MSTVQRRAHLAPRPDSARRARRIVATALAEAGRDDLVETAELLVSELVTNSVVHARTPIELVVTADRAGLRVAVHDGSAHLPSLRQYGRTATTGRGLELLTLLAHRHGTDADADAAGKTVWFEMGAGPDQPPGQGGARSSHGGREEGRPVEVRLLRVPVVLVMAWRQHVDTLLREDLLAHWETTAGGDVAPDGRAHDAFAQVADALGPLTRSPAGTERADVSLSVTAEDAAGFEALDLLLEEVLARAERGQMLAPTTQPEVRLLRQWICGQVRQQVRGRAAEPWPGLPTEMAAPDVPGPDWDVGHVTRSSEALVAADDLNRVVAVSPAALALLGWDGALVGRRIVEIVPPRLRERHIAGFTRHLLTGEGVILDTEVRVPALRRDGSEVEVHLLVRREYAADGRPCFVATLREA